MQAMILTQAGGSENLSLVEKPVPELTTPNQVRVRIHAAGVNPVDWKMRDRGGIAPEQMPIILGCEGAGIIDCVGQAVSAFKPGDEVYWMNGGIGGALPGNYAQYTVLDQDYVALKPKSLSMIEAAALPLAWITAWESLVDRVQLGANMTLLILGGTGGVGHLAIQLARHLGARVAVTVSSAEKAEFARSLGAEYTILYPTEEITQSTLAWSAGHGVDRILDTVGGQAFCHSFAAIKTYGKIVTLLEAPCEAAAYKQAKQKNVGLYFELMLTPMLQNLHSARVAQRHMLEAAAQMVAQGKLSVHISQTFPLAEASAALRSVESGHTQGKIVLDCT